MSTLFDFLNSINTTKEYLLVDAQAEKDYIPFMVNRGMSLFQDTILYANEMNRYPDIPKKLQYEFYINSIAARKRFSKWPKKLKESDDLKVVAEHFKCSYEKAKTYLSILTQTQVEEIKAIQCTGGLSK